MPYSNTLRYLSHSKAWCTFKAGYSCFLHQLRDTYIGYWMVTSQDVCCPPLVLVMGLYCQHCSPEQILKIENFMVDHTTTDRGMLWLFRKLYLGQKGVQCLTNELKWLWHDRFIQMQKDFRVTSLNNNESWNCFTSQKSSAFSVNDAVNRCIQMSLEVSIQVVSVTGSHWRIVSFSVWIWIGYKTQELELE